MPLRLRCQSNSNHSHIRSEVNVCKTQQLCYLKKYSHKIALNRRNMKTQQNGFFLHFFKSRVQQVEIFLSICHKAHKFWLFESDYLSYLLFSNMFSYKLHYNDRFYIYIFIRSGVQTNRYCFLNFYEIASKMSNDLAHFPSLIEQGVVLLWM